MSAKITPAKGRHPWSAEGLLTKAQRYREEMSKHSPDDWRFALWSSLTLEFLARAVIASRSPALLADPRERDNLFYALGHTPTAKKFVPRSIDTRTVLASLRELVPTFTSELEGFSAQHFARRNEELHSAGLPFDGGHASWLPMYYEACSVLLKVLGKTLAFLLGTSEATAARKMIAASKSESAKAVLKTIATHKKQWTSLSGPEHTKLRQQATAWATRHAGHRVQCPSCASTALVTGVPIAAPSKNLKEDIIVETQQYLPATFECVACKLKISGLSRLTASGLGSPYKATFSFDAAEYYRPDDDDEFYGFDDDNNEY